MTTTTQTFAAQCLEHGLSMGSCRFVPFSQSRNAQEKQPNLNYVVGIHHNGRLLFELDYSMGQAYCPSYKTFKAGSYEQRQGIAIECETGKIARKAWGYSGNAYMSTKGIPTPNPSNILSCIFLDCSALNYSSFEEWARDFGYDTDSIKAKSVYDTCLGYALKLRNSLGDEVFTKLSALAAEQ